MVFYFKLRKLLPSKCCRDLISNYHQNHYTILQLEVCLICYSQQISSPARDLLWTWSRFLSAFRGHEDSKSSLKESSSWLCRGLGVLNDKLWGDEQVPALISASGSLHPVYSESRISLNHKTLITTHWSAVHVNWPSSVTEASTSQNSTRVLTVCWAK